MITIPIDENSNIKLNNIYFNNNLSIKKMIISLLLIEIISFMFICKFINMYSAMIFFFFCILNIYFIYVILVNNFESMFSEITVIFINKKIKLNNLILLNNLHVYVFLSNNVF